MSKVTTSTRLHREFWLDLRAPAKFVDSTKGNLSKCLFVLFLVLSIHLSPVTCPPPVNPCHSECKPFHCHGPLETHCSACTGNRELKIDKCVCKKGYFDYGGQKCSIYSEDCIQATIGAAGAIFCNKCEHAVNGPINGNCVKKNYMYYESGTTATPQERLESSRFFSFNFCNSLTNPTPTDNRCSSCIHSARLNLISGYQCVPCDDKGCLECDNSGACVSGCADGQFMKSGACTFCFMSCRTCVGDLSTDCKSCKDGYYFQKNLFDAQGSCVPCHANCQSCFGPGSHQCSEVKAGVYYVDTQLRTTAPCSSDCTTCEGSADHCTACFTRASSWTSYILNLQTNSCEEANWGDLPSRCIEGVKDVGGTITCRLCGTGYYYDSSQGNCIDITQTSICKYNRIDASLRDYECVLGGDLCSSDTTMSYDIYNKQCAVELTNNRFCQNSFKSGLRDFCMTCRASNKHHPVTGNCQSACPPTIDGRTVIETTFEGKALCVFLPPGCLQGHFDSSQKFFCTQCDQPNFIKLDPAHGFCTNLICNNAFMSFNKECTPVNNPGVCDSILCLRTDTSECTSGNCKRKIFDFEFFENKFVIKVSDKYKNHFSFDVRDYAVYDQVSSPSTVKRVFCGVISDDLIDGLSLCHMKNGQLEIDVSHLLYSRLLVTKKLTIKKFGFAVYRKYLSLDNVDINDPANHPSFDFEKELTLDVSKQKSSDWIVLSQPVALLSKGLQATVHSRGRRLQAASYSWECLSVGSDPSKKTQVQALLNGQTGSKISLPITDASFNGQPIQLKSQVTDTLGQTHEETFEVTLKSQNEALRQVSEAPIFYVYQDEGVYVPLLLLDNSLTTGDITITAEGIGASDYTQEFKSKPNHLLLKVKVIRTASWQSFKLKLTPPSGYLPLTLTFVYRRLALPSIVFHQKKSGQEFEVDIHSKFSKANIYCINEQEANRCGDPTAETTEINPSLGVSKLILKPSITGQTTESSLLFAIRLKQGEEEMVLFSNVKTAVQGETLPALPQLDTRQGYSIAEHESYQTDEDFYIDFKSKTIVQVTPLESTSILEDLSKESSTGTYQIEDSKSQVSQTGHKNRYFRANTLFEAQIQETSGPVSFKLSTSRFITFGEVITVSASQRPFNNLLQVDLISTQTNKGGICSHGENQIFNLFELNRDFLLADIGSSYTTNFVPSLFKNSALKVKSTLYSYCGILSSSEINFKDDSGLPLGVGFNQHVANILAESSYSLMDSMNRLNSLLMQITHAYQICKADPSACPSDSANLKVQGKNLLTQLAEIYEDNKFFITLRHSFLHGFFTQPGFVDSPEVETILDKLEKTTTHTKNRLATVVSAEPRLSRALHQKLSKKDQLLATRLDLPIKTATHLLDHFIFSYSKTDSERNAIIRRVFDQIIRQTEFKMLRVSSHKRVEISEAFTAASGKNVRVQAMTVISPLESEYTFNLQNDTILVFKDLAFATSKSYYEIVVFDWATAFVDKLKPLFKDENNGFKNNQYFAQFMNAFESQSVSSGQAQVYSKTCDSPQIGSCTPSPNINSVYKFCLCQDLSTAPSTYPELFKRTAPVVVPPDQKDDPPVPNPSPSPIPFPPEDKKDDKSKPNVIGDIEGALTKPNTETLNIAGISNYKLWIYSTIVLFLILTLFFLLCIWKKKAIRQKCNKYADAVSTQVLIHKVLIGEIDDRVGLTSCEVVNADVETGSAENGSTTTGSDSGASRAMRTLRHLSRNPANKIDLGKIRQKDLKPLSFWSFYWVYLKLNHTMLSILHLQSVQYTKMTIIVLTYLRIITHLGVSMYFTLSKLTLTLDVSKEDYTENQRWVLKVLIIPVPFPLIFLIIRKLLAGEVDPFSRVFITVRKEVQKKQKM